MAENKSYTTKVTKLDEKMFLHFIFEKYQQFNKVDAEFFEDEDIRNIFIVAKDQYNKDKKKKAVDISLLYEIVKSAEFGKNKKQIEDKLLKSILTIDDEDFEKKKEYYEEKFKKWKTFRLLDITLNQQIDEFRDILPFDGDKLDSYISKQKIKIQEIVEVSNDDDDSVMDFDDIENRNYDLSTKKVPTGYTLLDEITDGGFDYNTLVVFLGQTNVGKCSSGCNLLEIKNNITNEIMKISFEQFYKIIKDEKRN